MQPLFDKSGGYRRLNSFHFATLVRRAMAMLAGQIRQQGETFLSEGGFRERLTQRRVEARDAQQAATAPACPVCGQPMRCRTARKGPHAGEAFWSCSGYPECNGIRPIEAADPGPRTPGPGPPNPEF